MLIHIVKPEEWWRKLPTSCPSTTQVRKGEVIAFYQERQTPTGEWEKVIVAMAKCTRSVRDRDRSGPPWSVHWDAATFSDERTVAMKAATAEDCQHA